MKDYLRLITNKNLLGFYSSTLLRAISKSLVRIFVAVYLLKLGYNLRSVIIEFMTLKSVVWPFASVAAERFCTKFGTKLTITLGTIWHVLYMWLLIAWPKWNFRSLVALGCISGLSEGIFWTGYHIHVASRSSDDNRGKAIITIKTLVIIANSVGALTGGILSATTDFTRALMLSMFCLILSNACLLLAPDMTVQSSESLESSLLIPLDISWLTWRDVIVILSHGMEQCLMSVWALYTSLNFFDLKYQIIGLNNGMSTMFSIVTHLFFGRLIDKNRKYSLIVGILMTTLAWTLRLFVLKKWGVFLNDIFFSLSHSLLGSAFTTISYDKGMATHLHSFVVIQETFVAIGQAFIWILTLYFPTLYYVLSLGPLLTMLQVLLTPVNATAKHIVSIE